MNMAVNTSMSININVDMHIDINMGIYLSHCSYFLHSAQLISSKLFYSFTVVEWHIHLNHCLLATFMSSPRSLPLPVILKKQKTKKEN